MDQYNIILSCQNAVTAYLKNKQLLYFGSKHEALSHCCYNAGPFSATLAQHYNNSGTTLRVYSYTARLLYEYSLQLIT